jgi:DNA polymerase III subunit epsilon
MSQWPSFVAFDVETTGLDAEKNRIIELAGVKFTFEDNAGKLVVKVLDRFESLVKPDMRIPEDATRINHITNEMVEDAPPAIDVLQQFIRFCGLSTILVAHNAEFDCRFLSREIRENKIMGLKNPIWDSLKLSRKIMSEAPTHKLGDLAKRLRREISLQLESGALHRALYDCEVLAEVFTVLLRKRFTAKDLEYSNIIKSVEKVHGPSLVLKLQ